jgi:hypothetical protein
VAWPPATATAETPWSSDFSIVVREGGADQWVFKGRPLYRFAGDAKPGEVNGDNQGGVWHAIRSAPPRGEPIKLREPLLRLLTARGRTNSGGDEQCHRCDQNGRC